MNQWVVFVWRLLTVWNMFESACDHNQCLCIQASSIGIAGYYHFLPVREHVISITIFGNNQFTPITSQSHF